ncbi:MAG TPA: carboxypeptidase-like regulatory domain-containing protein [Puia sp.]
MTDKDKHMALYTSSDIEKYLSGELSDPEMHAMERAALDDPFLADALEGMVVHRNLPEQPGFLQDMTDLQKRLEERVSKDKDKRRIIPLMVRYAAAALLFLGLGAAAYYALYPKKMNRNPLARNEVKVPTQPPAAASTAAPAAASTVAPAAASTPDLPAGSAFRSEAAADSTSQTLEDGKAIADNERVPALKKQGAGHIIQNDKYSIASNDNRNSHAKQQMAPQANNYVMEDKAANTSYEARLFKPAIDSSRGFADSLHFSQRGLTPEMAMVYTGKVISPQNIPLAGAKLSFKKGRESFNAVTDANGYFTLRLPKNDTTSKVAVNSIGYEEGYMTLDNDARTGNIIQLKPQQQGSLNEVTVSGYGALRKELTRTDINSVPQPLSPTAVPAEGWPAYSTYLETNKNTARIDTTIRGFESISFSVNKKGELSSFKVERSLSPAHDSLAIRLVKEGPAWKLLKGKKERARVVLTW